MPFPTFDCQNCGTEFKALEGSNAAESGYCSPACQSEARGD